MTYEAEKKDAAISLAEKSLENAVDSARELIDDCRKAIGKIAGAKSVETYRARLDEVRLFAREVFTQLKAMRSALEGYKNAKELGSSDMIAVMGMDFTLAGVTACIDIGRSAYIRITADIAQRPLP